MNLRDQKQAEYEAIVDYLEKRKHEKSIYSVPFARPSGLTSYIREKVEDLKGVDHEFIRKSKLEKIEKSINEVMIFDSI